MAFFTLYVAAKAMPPRIADITRAQVMATLSKGNRCELAKDCNNDAPGKVLPPSVNIPPGWSGTLPIISLFVVMAVGPALTGGVGL